MNFFHQLNSFNIRPHAELWLINYTINLLNSLCWPLFWPQRINGTLPPSTVNISLSQTPVDLFGCPCRGARERERKRCVQGYNSENKVQLSAQYQTKMYKIQSNLTNVLTNEFNLDATLLFIMWHEGRKFRRHEIGNIVVNLLIARHFDWEECKRGEIK